MQLFIDSANVEDVRHAHELGPVDGVTTNPSLVSSTDRAYRAIYDTHGFETDVLAASIRHPKHVTDAAMVGADIATIPARIADSLFEHPKTEGCLQSFLDDWGDRPSPALEE